MAACPEKAIVAAEGQHFSTIARLFVYFGFVRFLGDFPDSVFYRFSRILKRFGNQNEGKNTRFFIKNACGEQRGYFSKKVVLYWPC